MNKVLRTVAFVASSRFSQFRSRRRPRQLPNTSSTASRANGRSFAAKATPWPNPANKTPDWVAERHEGRPSRHGRSNDFRPGQDLPRANGRNSRITRGAGSTAATWPCRRHALGRTGRGRVYLSNMAPQVGVGMNRGFGKTWKKTRAWAVKRTLHLHRPIYEDPMQSGHRVERGRRSDPLLEFSIPSASGRSRSSCRIRRSTQPTCRTTSSVQEVEGKTGLLFWAL